MSITRQIKEKILEYKTGDLIFATKLWQECFSHVTQTAYFKAIERLTKANVIMKVSKGTYCIPKASKYGLLPISSEQIIEYYLGKNMEHGLAVGYSLYAKKNLTTQIAKYSEYYSTLVEENKKVINNLVLKKTVCKITPKTKNIIETLEILQNFSTIQEFNYKAFIEYCLLIASNHDEKSFEAVIHAINYKKSTLAFYKQILNYYNVKNNVDKSLSAFSNYNIPSMRCLNEFAQQ